MVLYHVHPALPSAPEDDVHRQARGAAAPAGQARARRRGDTFRAGAIDQLRVWAERTAADFVGSKAGTDPAPSRSTRSRPGSRAAWT
jgi:hypothetical protein